jgi:hypothetical protein
VRFQLVDVQPDVAVRVEYCGLYRRRYGSRAASRVLPEAVHQAAARAPAGPRWRQLEEGPLRQARPEGANVIRDLEPWPRGAHQGRQDTIVFDGQAGKQAWLTPLA